MIGGPHLRRAAIALPIIWLIGLYLVWLDYEDCPKALGRSEGFDSELYASLLIECGEAANLVTIVVALGAIAFAPALICCVLFWIRSSGD